MPDPVAPAEIFDRSQRRIRRDRAAARFADHDFLIAEIRRGLLDRLDIVTRPFKRALDLGCFDGRLSEALRARGIDVVSADAGHRFARGAGGVQCDEDRLPFRDGSFDLVLSAGVLDQVNDLPGALALVRRVLMPDGLFLAGFIGGGSLALLRSALLTADLDITGHAIARINPQIDLKASADLLGRAGFALPVADGERLSVRYRDPLRLFADLRGMAATRLLRDHSPAITRRGLARIFEALADKSDEQGVVTEAFELIYLTGWAPSPDQPKPARRGSGTTSLAATLGKSGSSEAAD